MKEQPIVLVVGGAGYIGSHAVWMLGQEGVNVVTLDNLSTGHRDAVLCGDFVKGDLADKPLLHKLFSEYKFDAVMHFASCIVVSESVKDPAKYYENNVVNTLNLLNAMVEHGVDKLIFSSSAAIFGNPQYIPIDENHPKNPINPYGRTKLMIEQILQDYDQAYKLKSVSLRYFNAAGAHPEAMLGEQHEPETHLIPLALQAADGRFSSLTVFGRDYETPDGTCIRDYIHVLDLVRAHHMALDFLLKGGSSKAFNLGSGNGFSTNEVIKVVREVTNKNFQVQNGDRRMGDPARLLAQSKLIESELGWQPIYSNIKTIVKDAWQWELKRTFKIIGDQSKDHSRA